MNKSILFSFAGAALAAGCMKSSSSSSPDAAPPPPRTDAGPQCPQGMIPQGEACFAASTCLEIKFAQPTSVDGDYTLFVGHDGKKPWSVYCAQMATAPAEYLTLINVGPDKNFSQYTASGSQGSDVRTNYTRVRIDPVTFAVDVDDETYSTSTGSLMHGANVVTSMPFGVAMDCVGPGSQSGLGNVDIGGTPFAIVDPFGIAGASAAGTATPSSDSRAVVLRGGGNCGWISSAPAAFNPFNLGPAAPLNLVYSP